MNMSSSYDFFGAEYASDIDKLFEAINISTNLLKIKDLSGGQEVARDLLGIKETYEKGTLFDFKLEI